MKLAAALLRACQGRQKSLGIDLFGERYGEQEISRYLRGERGEKMLTLLEAAFDADPDALADYCRERFGWRIERPTNPLPQQLELIFAEVRGISERQQGIQEQLERIAEQHQRQTERAGMVRVEPAVSARRRRA